MPKDYELRNAMRTIAQDMHSNDPNPTAWLTYLVYLLNQLEEQAMDANPMNQQRYKDMLSQLQDKLHSHRQTGGW
jgi:hypothetical protein